MDKPKSKREGPGKRGMIFAEMIRSDWRSQILAKVQGSVPPPPSTPIG